MSVRFSLERLRLLIVKEIRQILRDRSVFTIALGLPVLLLVMYGYGIRMDIDRVPVILVLEERTPAAVEVAQAFAGSRQFEVTEAATRVEAEKRFEAREAEMIVQIPSGFAQKLEDSRAEISVTIYGVDAQTAVMMRSYAQGTVAAWAQERGFQKPADVPVITLQNRNWFNDENDSTRYLVPGLLILVLSIAGSFMCSLVIAREWERSTMPSLLVTPAAPLEIFLAKWLPYGVLSVASFLLALGIAFLLFDTRVVGSWAFLFATAVLYAVWSTSLGLFLSAKIKNQFLANECAVVVSFLPTMMLSGFIFDLRSVPTVISVIGHLFPPTYAMESLKICFLSGGNEDILWRNLFILLLWCVPTVSAALHSLQKTGTASAAKKGSVS